MNINREQDYKKGDVVKIEKTEYIIMAVLSGPREETTYNICTTELLAPRFGVIIEADNIIPYQSLSDIIKRRVQGFL